MRKKIGFNAQQDDQDDVKDIDLMEEAREKTIAVLTQYINVNYSNEGDTDQKEFRTSMEIIYELREMMDVSISLLNRTLNEMEFKMQFLEGVPNWVMYRKN